MTIVDEGRKFAGGIKKGGQRRRRAERQKKKIKRAKASGDDERVARLKDKRKKTKRDIRKADKQAVRSGVDITKRTVKAGSAVASGNPVGAVVEFV